MSNVIASFEVLAGTTAEGDLNLDGLTPDQMAARIENELIADTSLCHECAHRITDPEPGELAGFSVDGRHFEKVDGAWTELKVMAGDHGGLEQPSALTLTEMRDETIGNVPLEVDDELLRRVWRENPDLVALAVIWSWGDTEVRDQLCAAVEDLHDQRRQDT